MPDSYQESLRIAEAVQAACTAAAKRAFDDAAISGLCHDGAVECAVGAIKALDLTAIVEHELKRNPS
jgi:hypothetical protein